MQPGQLVCHRHYQYRAVVVDLDQSCRADESWYQSNQTQPSRDQPWYHLLVHDSDRCTYAAEENLEPDPSDHPIEHPLVIQFFTGFYDGKYERNDEPWPAW